jgi:hypothetical protein
MADSMKISWWQWLPIHRWRIIGMVDSADEIPDQLPRNAAVLVGSHRFNKWIGFDCPCRKGHRIVLNLDGARSPSWQVSQGNRLTISPSVDYHDDKKRCHYFVRGGKIVWAGDTFR